MHERKVEEMNGLILVFVLLVLTLALRVAINIIRKKKRKLEAFVEEPCEDPCETCLRWSECNGCDKNCPLRKEHE